MSTAVSLSVVIHVFLIYGFSLPVDSAPVVRDAVIHARLDLPRAAVNSPRAKRREFNAASESAPFMPTTSPPPVPQTALGPVLETAPLLMSIADETKPALANSDTTAGLNISDPVQYPAKDLDIYPQPLRPIAPVYPSAAREAQLAGFVTLMVSIDETGRVIGTSVTDAAPDGVFEQVAQQALAVAAFYPAQKEGRTVRSRILVKVEFDPALADATQ
jgi:periplasmic protein TonB